MKKKILAILCVLLAIFNGFLFFKTFSTRHDSNLDNTAYLVDPDSLDEYEGQIVIIVDKLRYVDEARDEDTGLEFWEPLVAKTRQVEKYDRSSGYTWSNDGITQYIYGGVNMAHYPVQKELLIPLIGSEETFPTRDSMEANGFSIYSYDTESQNFVAPDDEEESSGSGLTGRERYSFRGFEPDGDSTFTLIATFENGELVIPDLNLGTFVYDEVKTLDEITEAESKNSTMVLIVTAVLTLAFLAGGVVLFIKSKYD